MIVFVIVFGMMYTLLPMILGAFFSVVPPVMNSDWQAINVIEQNTIKFLIQLMPSMGIAVIVFKTLLVSTTRGGD
jgi:hypothetical protein